MSKGLITVFGGSGFIGRYLVQRLAEADWQVRVACRFPEKARFVTCYGTPGQIVPVYCNLTSEVHIASALERADAAINLVGLLAEGGRQRFDSVQRDGAARIARQVAAQGLTDLVQVSAIGADASSASRYGRTKAEAEQAVLDAVPTARIVRPSIVFGPEDDFFNRFARMSALSPALPLVGGGVTRFQPVYVCDVVSAIMTVLEDESCAGKTYELGGPEVLSFKQLLERMLKHLNRKRVLVPLSWPIASAMSQFMQYIPNPPLTPDQVVMLRKDNVVSDNYPGFDDLGITPQCLDIILPSYLDQYRSK